MELVWHRTTVIIVQPYKSRTRSYGFTMIVYREAEVNIWTRLQSYDGCAISYDVVRRRTTIAQHREKAVHMRTCENMVQTSATSHYVKRGRTMSCDNYWTILYNLGHRNEVFEHDQMASTSYDIARLRTIHPDGPWSPKLRPSHVVVRCLNARCDHSLRSQRPSHKYLVRWSCDLLRPCAAFEIPTVRSCVRNTFFCGSHN